MNSNRKRGKHKANDLYTKMIVLIGKFNVASGPLSSHRGQADRKQKAKESCVDIVHVTAGQPAEDQQDLPFEEAQPSGNRIVAEL